MLEPYRDIWAGHRVVGAAPNRKQAGGRGALQKAGLRDTLPPLPKPYHRHEWTDFPSAALRQCATCKGTEWMDGA